MIPRRCGIRSARSGSRLCLALALVLLWAIPTGVHGQTPAAAIQQQRIAGYVHESWTVEDGLPVNGVNALLQSRDGYIWAATWDGLVRFDGVRFTVFNAATSPGLWSNRLVSIHEARDSSLWLRDERGQLIRFRHGRFTRYGDEQGFPGGAITLTDDVQGTVWVGGWSAFWRVQGDRVVPAVASASPNVYDIAPRRDGSVWLRTERPGVYRFRDGTIEKVRADVALDSATLHAVLADDRGRVWLATSAGLWVDDGALRPLLFEGKPVYDARHVAFSAAQETVYAFTPRGVLRIAQDLTTSLDERVVLAGDEPVAIDPAGAVWHARGSHLFRDGRLATDLTARSSREGDAITHLAMDREGSVWVATATTGLHRVKPALFTTLSEPEGLAHRNAYAVYEDGNGTIWVGTLFGGISRIDAGGRITRFSGPGYPSFASSFHSDRSDRIWVGSTAGLLECRLPAMSCGPAPAVIGGIAALFADSRGVLWIGLGTGVAALENWRPVQLAAFPVSAAVRAFAESPDGAIWMGTNGAGVLRYHDGRYTRVTAADGLPSDLIRALYVDADGWLWIGSEGHGIGRLDTRAWSSPGEPGDRRIAQIGTPNGLFDNAIHQILEDDAGRLWMNTNRGVFWVPRDELVAFADGRISRVHSTSYNERDGIRNREGNGGSQPAGVRARDGRLWFPTQDGVVVVDPADIMSNRLPPPVVIERVVAGDTAFVPDGTPLGLDVDQRDLEIEFTALSFLEPGNVRFRYRLEPYDDAWVEAGSRRTAFYTRVPPGRYTFRVIASNNEGIWNEGGAALDLSLASWPWETAAFRVLFISVLAAMLLMLMRWRGRRLQMRAIALERVVDERTHELRAREQQLAAQNEQLGRQAIQLQELDRAKSNFFANVSHEFRTPLTLTIGPLEDLQADFQNDNGHRRRSLDMALRNARRLLRLVNQILDVAKLDAAEMKLKPRPLDLVPFTRGVAAAFDRVADARAILLTVEAPDSLCGAFDPDALEKVLTNLLSNALKFTPEGGHVAVEVRESDGDVLLTVRDTGPGIAVEHLPHVFDRFYQVDETNSRAQPGTGIGLSLVKELVKLHGGSIEVRSGAGTGAEFVARFPLGIVSESEAAGNVAPITAIVAADSATPQAEHKEVASDDVPVLLVVDDNPDLRAYVREHLTRRFRVMEAGDGATALQLARTHLPDVIVSDVMMPGMDGHTLVRHLHASSETDFLPVILLTAQAAPEQRIAGLEHGVDDYIAKPFEMRELEVRIDNLIASRKRLRARFATASPIEMPARSSRLSPRDLAFLKRVHEAIQANIADAEFGVAELANAVFQDRSHLYRRVHELLGESPSDLIRRVRLEHACRLLDEDAGSIAHIAYASGFNSVSYFSRCFRDAYGRTPTEYRTPPTPPISPD